MDDFWANGPTVGGCVKRGGHIGIPMTAVRCWRFRRMLLRFHPPDGWQMFEHFDCGDGGVTLLSSAHSIGWYSETLGLLPFGYTTGPLSVLMFMFDLTLWPDFTVIFIVMMAYP